MGLWAQNNGLNKTEFRLGKDEKPVFVSFVTQNACHAVHVVRRGARLLKSGSW
jgi:hypothetical protein